MQDGGSRIKRVTRDAWSEVVYKRQSGKFYLSAVKLSFLLQVQASMGPPGEPLPHAISRRIDTTIESSTEAHLKDGYLKSEPC